MWIIRYFDQTDQLDIHIRLNSYLIKHLGLKSFRSDIYVDNYPIRLKSFLDTIFSNMDQIDRLNSTDYYPIRQIIIVIIIYYACL